MYDLSTPTHPDHLADITAGMRAPARITPQSNADAYGVLAKALSPDDEKRKQAIAMQAASAMQDTAAVALENIAKIDAPIRPEYIAGARTDPYGMRFPWGPIIEQHQIGPYTILEYLEDTSAYDNATAWERHGRTLYHVYVDGKNTAVSATSLDSALAGAIAYRRDGANSHAGDYFMRMVGGD